ncbi:MAG: CoA pyrophosphatase [Bacteroidales bacterium]|nr:CoA pyrophosphatase [Bacteroidales bacterium]
MNLSPQIIKKKLLQPLPGLSSHLKMAPASRAGEIARFNGNLRNARKSAVMILLFHEDERLKVILIRRSFYVGIHAGQIAFPGGRYEESDADIKHTALREIYEEVGIPAEKIEVIGRLSDIYVPPSNFLISVFVGYLNEKPRYKADEREVAEIIEIDMDDFFREDVIQEKEFVVPSAKISVNALYYKVGNVDLWGASAMVMAELLDVLSEI